MLSYTPVKRLYLTLKGINFIIFEENNHYILLFCFLNEIEAVKVA